MTSPTHPEIIASNNPTNREAEAGDVELAELPSEADELELGKLPSKAINRCESEPNNTDACETRIQPSAADVSGYGNERDNPDVGRREQDLLRRLPAATELLLATVLVLACSTLFAAAGRRAAVPSVPGLEHLVSRDMTSFTGAHSRIGPKSGIAMCHSALDNPSRSGPNE